MRKIKMLISALVIFATSFCFVPNASAVEIVDESDVSRYGYEYTIDKYHVDVVVNEDRTFDITEEIEAYFRVEKHGIFRSIPVHGELARQDGSESKYRARISNIKVSEKYTTSYEEGNLKIKIGDADVTHTGKRTYRISYTYNMGEDPLEDIDEFYYNLVGTGWDAPIESVSFEITMPKKFDAKNLGISTGSYGSTGTEKVLYRASDKKIYGQTIGSLRPYEGLTVRVELPEGYFVGAGIEIDQMTYVYFAVPAVLFLIVLGLWSKYGKDKKIFVKPEYFPPEGKNSLDVGFLYKGAAGSEDVLSLLIYLANNGYLTIEETDEKQLFGTKKGFILRKVKEYDGKNSNEKTFFKGLFKSGDEVKSKDLYDKFYKTTTSIIADVNKSENRNKIFEKRGKIIALAVLMVLISMISISIPPFMDLGDYSLIIMSVMFPGMGFTAMALGIIYMFTAKTKSARGAFAFLIFWGMAFGGVPFIFMIIPELLYEPVYLYGYAIGMAFIIAQIVVVRLLPKRTDYGVQMLAEIQGFKDFLTSVEKDRIEQMVEQYPNYFFDILPYTYVLGISDKWIKKFEEINLKSPDWYAGDVTAFNMATFGSFMSSTMSAASSNMGSTATHSSGGGGGGGGFSGGGGGGGGGGSW